MRLLDIFSPEERRQLISEVHESSDTRDNEEGTVAVRTEEEIVAFARESAIRRNNPGDVSKVRKVRH
jgi:hypothetical protein